MKNPDSTNQKSPVKIGQEQLEPMKEEAKFKNMLESYVIIEKNDSSEMNLNPKENQEKKEDSNDFINDFYILENIPEEIKNHPKKKESRFLKFFKTMFSKKEDAKDIKEKENVDLKDAKSIDEFSNDESQRQFTSSEGNMPMVYSKIIEENYDDCVQNKDNLNILNIDKVNEFNPLSNKWMGNPSFNSFGSLSTATNNNSILPDSPAKNVSTISKEDSKLLPNDLIKINLPQNIKSSLTAQFKPANYSSANKSTILSSSGVFLGNSFNLHNSNISNDSANSVRFPTFLSPKLLNSSQSKYVPDELDLTVRIEKILSLEDKRTTLMIKNIPNKFTRQVLLTILEQRMKETFDLFILPTDANKFKNFGYGFINFLNSYYIPYFYFMFNGKMWSGTNSKKVCEITYSKIQGHQNLIGHYPSKIIHWNGIAHTAAQDQKYIIPKDYLPYFRSVFKDSPIEEFKYYFLTKLPKIDAGNQ